LTLGLLALVIIRLAKRSRKIRIGKAQKKEEK